MGDPKKSRKKYLGGKPRRLWNRQLLEEELRLIGEYGLRNKRELWIAKAMLREIKHRARSLLSMPPEQRAVLEAAFKARLFKAGFLPEQDIPLDAVLSLDVRAILDRRLQTIVYRRGLAKTIYEARQLIVHGHIAVDGRVVKSPGYLVPRELEDKVTYSITSPILKRLLTQQTQRGTAQ
ncbi:30S ribosomal protein S4 [Vulcanisaeta sp. EB80]|uniref:30S ribosomal protein S4 n=1 Tax=Vulcanisaeta sp. EB80 TaxID=1650660 RepID=UPI0009C0FE17|nr:30S ribosomal protein S4 [Vulcanisaeta sp. EB80]PLC68860.1 30S ribosomal protein S4 [Vulcanisaeta sp. EB80]